MIRSALEQKKVEEEKKFGAIDYDAPVEPKSSTVGLGTKVAFLTDAIPYQCEALHMNIDQE